MNELIVIISGVECPILTELEFGRLECSLTNLAGSKCDLQCDYGYKLTGRKILKCSILGYWSSPMPKCKGKHCVIWFKLYGYNST